MRTATTHRQAVRIESEADAMTEDELRQWYLDVRLSAITACDSATISHRLVRRIAIDEITNSDLEP